MIIFEFERSFISIYLKAVAAEGCVVTHVDYDAMDFASVRAAAKTVLAATPELDVLCTTCVEINQCVGCT